MDQKESGGNVISGIHSLDWQQYCDAGGISSSMLDVLIDECPEALKAVIDGRRSRKTKALEFGALFHSYVLEPDSLTGAFHIKPEGMSFAETEGKVWKKAHADRPIVKAEDVVKTIGMVESLHANADFMALFQGGTSEQCLFAEDKQGILRKARMDRLHQSGNYILDLKSCDCASPAAFSRAIDKYGYYRKAAWYLEVASLCGLRKEIFFLVAVEKEPPFISQVYQVEMEDLQLGQGENDAAMLAYQRCLKSGVWPAYGGGIRPLGMPEYRRSQLTQRLSS